MENASDNARLKRFRVMVTKGIYMSQNLSISDYNQLIDNNTAACIALDKSIEKLNNKKYCKNETQIDIIKTMVSNIDAENVAFRSNIKKITNSFKLYYGIRAHDFDDGKSYIVCTFSSLDKMLTHYTESVIEEFGGICNKGWVFTIDLIIDESKINFSTLDTVPKNYPHRLSHDTSDN